MYSKLLTIAIVIYGIAYVQGCKNFSADSGTQLSVVNFSKDEEGIHEQLQSMYGRYEKMIVLKYVTRKNLFYSIKNIEYHLIVDTVIPNYYPRWHLNVFYDGELVIADFKLSHDQNEYIDNLIDIFTKRIKQNEYVHDNQHLQLSSTVYLSIQNLEYLSYPYDRSTISSKHFSTINNFIHNIKPVLFDIENLYGME